MLANNCVLSTCIYKEGGGRIEELHPPLPLVEITPPPLPAVNAETTLTTPHLMPLMALVSPFCDSNMKYQNLYASLQNTNFQLSFIILLILFLKFTFYFLNFRHHMMVMAVIQDIG